jgi:signal peptide peptidase SppA
LTSNVDKLSGLSNRPFWAILGTVAQELILQALREADGTEAAAHVDADVQEKRDIFSGLASALSAQAPTGTKTAVIPILGPLSSDDWYGTSYSFIQEAVDKAANDPNVGEIILLVDSPGGEVTGLPETAEMIYNAAKSKPVTAMVTGMAASAAYYLASQATNLVLTPSGEVGSVGVLMIHADITKMLEKTGIKVTAISAGKYKTEFWPFTPLSEEAQAAAQTTVDDLYQGFLAAIQRGRGSRATKAGIDSNFGNGRMLTAKEAGEAGMIDAVSTMREVFKARADRNRVALELRRLETL